MGNQDHIGVTGWMVVMFHASVSMHRAPRACCPTIVGVIMAMRMTATGFMAVGMLVVPAVMTVLVIRAGYE